MALSIGRIWQKNEFIGILPKDDGGAIYGEMSTLAQVIMNAESPQKLITRQGLSQDLETGCQKLAIVKYLGVQIFKGDHNNLRFQPVT